MKTNTAKLIIHGGAGALEGSDKRIAVIRARLREILDQTYQVLSAQGAMGAVLHGVCQLEDDPMFNAGRGSKYQADGHIRMSAAIMDGATRRFAGVINIQAVQNPIQIAARLLTRKHRVLAAEQAVQFARDQGVAVFDPGTPLRLEQHRKAQTFESGTVGVVALDAAGVIVAGTSTGGIGGETPGRVSDSATVAGNYATMDVGISATGIGEEIVDYALAARIAARVEDGLGLREAAARSMQAARQNGCRFGFIAIDRSGEIVTDNTTQGLFFGCHDGTKAEMF